jgi:glycosyltransferase involved in cell wall biosynthesis
MRWKLLLASHRFSYSVCSLRLIKKHFKELSEWSLDNVKVDDPSFEKELFNKRHIILRNPEFSDRGHCVSKGVLVVTFTTTFPYFLKFEKRDHFFRNYVIVLEPSWAGYALPEILAWACFKSPVIVQASERKDFEFITALNSNLVPVEFGASDWVNHELFYPIPSVTKKFDSLLVGNSTYVKRIHIFLKAIKCINCPTYKAAIVLGEWGEFYERIIGLIKFYGVNENVTVYKNLSPKDLNILYNESKVNVLLSLKEGSNRVIFEGFFAGTPGIVLADNIGVNKSYLNGQTGKVIEERLLSETLVMFRDNFDSYSPSVWARGNISCLCTTKKLSEVLTDSRFGFDYSSSLDLKVKVNAPEVQFYQV